MFSLNSDKKQSIRRYSNTSVYKNSYVCDVTLYDTMVCSVRWMAPALGLDPHADDAYTVTLNSGGWQTVTTKKRINEIAEELNLGFRVAQDNHVWYVFPYTRKSGWNHARIPFRDGMSFKCGMRWG